jgi:hypothetical protein
MKDLVLEYVNKVIQEKKDKNILPAICTDTELDHAIRNDVLKTLKSLYSDRIIKFGRTINNNNFIELIEDPNEKRKHIDLHKIYNDT